MSQSQSVTERKVQPGNAQCSWLLLSSTSCQRSTGFVCVVCRTAFATVFHLKLHGETPLHKSRVLWMKRKGENVSNPFLCELCDSACSTGRVMEFHLAGLKHATTLQEFEDAKRARAQGVSAVNR